MLVVILEQPDFCIDNQNAPHNATRRVRRIHVHPLYQKINQRPSYDFALIQVMRPLVFGTYLKPIDLPYKDLWRVPFYKIPVAVYGYGRVEKERIEGRDQTACETMRGELTVLHHSNPACKKVIQQHKKLI